MSQGSAERRQRLVPLMPHEDRSARSRAGKGHKRGLPRRSTRPAETTRHSDANARQFSCGATTGISVSGGNGQRNTAMTWRCMEAPPARLRMAVFRL